MMNNTVYVLDGCPENITPCDLTGKNISTQVRDYKTLMKTSFGLIASLSFFRQLALMSGDLYEEIDVK